MIFTLGGSVLTQAAWNGSPGALRMPAAPASLARRGVRVPAIIKVFERMAGVTIGGDDD